MFNPGIHILVMGWFFQITQDLDRIANVYQDGELQGAAGHLGLMYAHGHYDMFIDDYKAQEV